MAELECDGKATRAINAEIKKLISEGETRVFVRNPGARHNLGVAILEPVHLTFDGSVGYYCAGMVADLGNDAVVEEPDEADLRLLSETLERARLRKPPPAPHNFKKVLAGRKLWNFDKREWTTWREAL